VAQKGEAREKSHELNKFGEKETTEPSLARIWVALQMIGECGSPGGGTAGKRGGKGE